MGSEAALGAFLLKEFSEFAAGEFATAVGAKCFDFRPMLSLRPSCESFVGIKSLVLGA